MVDSVVPMDTSSGAGSSSVAAEKPVSAAGPSSSSAAGPSSSSSSSSSSSGAGPSSAGAGPSSSTSSSLSPSSSASTAAGPSGSGASSSSSPQEAGPSSSTGSKRKMPPPRERTVRRSKTFGMDAISMQVKYDTTVTSSGALRGSKKPKKPKRKKKAKKPSAAHYALYETAYDEPVELVMARFQMVEEMLAASREEKTAEASAKDNDNDENSDLNAPVVDKGKGKADDDARGGGGGGGGGGSGEPDGVNVLTEEQLETLFKKTTFKPLSVIIKEGEVKDRDGIDWNVDTDDEDASDGWSSSSGETRREIAKLRKEEAKQARRDEILARREARHEARRLAREARASRPRPPRKERRERNTDAFRELMVTSQRLDEAGRLIVLKKSVKYKDPKLPSLTKLPPGVGADFRKSGATVIRPYVAPRTAPREGAVVHMTDDLLSYDLSTCGKGYQGIYITPPWNSSVGAEGQPWAVTEELLGSLKIDDELIPYGLVFMWVEKDTVRSALKVMRQWGFEYAEGYSAVCKRVNNKFGVMDSPDAVFRSTKHSLIIGRKKKKGESGGDMLELRHQRNPDVNFEFRKRFANGAGVAERSDFIYRIIETMLPKARYDPEAEGTKLLQLWGNGYDNARPGWTVICDRRTILNPTPHLVL